MIVECTRENLAKGMGVVSRTISSKPTLPILSTVLLETRGGKLKLFGTDLELGSEVSIGAKVIKEGRVAAPARLLFDYITNNQDPIISLKKEGNVLFAESEHYKASISTQNDADFPTITPKEDIKNISVSKSEFIEAAKNVIIACLTDDSRPVLSGVFLSINKLGLKLVGTDSYRLAEYKITAKESYDFKPVIIPKRVIQELIRASSLSSLDLISIVIDDKEIRFKMGEIELFSRLIEGNFPDYEKIIPKSFTTKAVVNRNEFLSLVKAASVFNREIGSSVKVGINSSGALKIKSTSSELGQLESSMKVEFQGEEVDCAFSMRFLIDVLTVLTYPEIIFELNGKTNPAIIRPIEGDQYKYLMMPLRIE